MGDWPAYLQRACQPIQVVARRYQNNRLKNMPALRNSGSCAASGKNDSRYREKPVWVMPLAIRRARRMVRVLFFDWLAPNPS
jgi:hypothetical protein